MGVPPFAENSAKINLIFEPFPKLSGYEFIHYVTSVKFSFPNILVFCQEFNIRVTLKLVTSPLILYNVQITLSEGCCSMHGYSASVSRYVLMLA